MDFGTSNREHVCFEMRDGPNNLPEGSSCPYIFKEQGYWKIKVYDKKNDFFCWVVAHRRLVELYLSQKWGIPVKLHHTVEVHHTTGMRSDLNLKHLRIVGRKEHDTLHEEVNMFRSRGMLPEKYNKPFGIPIV